MSTALKCDICKTYYDPYEANAKKDLGNGIAIMALPPLNHQLILQTYDLCPTCMLKINGWVGIDSQ